MVGGRTERQERALHRADPNRSKWRLRRGAWLSVPQVPPEVRRPLFVNSQVWESFLVPRPPLVTQAFRSLPPTVRSLLLHARGDFAPWEDGFDFTPPKPGPGEETGPPDFVGVGVQKAGTSWWFELVSEHPGVFDRSDIPKERHYLSRFCIQPFGPAELQQYHGWFPRLPGTVAGEWTPDYFPYPWVAPVLAEAAPDAKILVLVRDPIIRFQSGLTFRHRMGAPHSSTTVADAVRQGLYARHLKRIYQFFPPDQVLVQQYEQCRDDPAGQLAITYAFLGLDPFTPTELQREVNVSGGARLLLDPTATDRLVDTYSADVAELAEMVPTLDLALWPRFVSDRGAAS